MRQSLFVLLFVSLCAAQASGQAVLYGLDVPGNVFTINVSTGMGSAVGVLPFGPYANPNLPGYNEMDYDNVNGQAWAQQRNGNFAAQEFNISNAAGIGGPVLNGASFHGLEYVGSTLYAAGFAGIDFAGAPGLSTLNPATGVSTPIGPFNTGSPMTGLAYDTGANVMYAIDGGQAAVVSTLYTISLVSGAATPVGATNMTAGSLEFGPDGNLYAGGVGLDQGNLFRISTGNGASTLVGATGFGLGMGNGISGLALVVPEPGGALLLFMGLGVLLSWRRRRVS